MEKTPGQVAFEEWVRLLDRPYPVTWNQMPESGKAEWESVAQEAIDRYLEIKGPHDVE